MRNVKVKVLVSLVILVIALIGINVGKGLYVEANLYKPATNKASSEHRYVEHKDQYGEYVTVFIPKTYENKKTNKWIIFAHGSNGSNLDLLKLPGENSLLKPLLDNGYVIVAPNYRDVINWGNKQGVEDLVAAYKLGKEKYNLEDNPYLILQSMGGLVGLTSISNDLIEPKAVVGIYPVTNLEFEYKNSHDTIPGYIEKAFGISNSSEFEKITKGYDPLNDNDGTEFKDVPILFISSYDDEIVPREPNADKFSELVNNSGGNVEVIEHKGNHGDVSAFKSNEIIEFFNKH